MRSPRWRCARPVRRPLRASRGEWERRSAAIVIAGVLDGLDGRIARLLRGQSRFGAELDSLSRQHRLRRVAGAHPLSLVAPSRAAVRLDRRAGARGLLALRLARFNARIDVKDQPHKSAGFITGVPRRPGRGWPSADLSCG